MTMKSAPPPKKSESDPEVSDMTMKSAPPPPLDSTMENAPSLCQDAAEESELLQVQEACMKSGPPPQDKKAAKAAKKAAEAAAAEAAAANTRPKVQRPVKAGNLDKSPEEADKLCLAATNGELEAVTQLLATVDPDALSSQGSTPLYEAALHGHVSVIEALLAAGADVAIGVGDETPMTAAFAKGNKEILGKLFAASFQTLESAVGGKSQAGPAPGPSDDEEEGFGDSAAMKLRKVTEEMVAGDKDTNSPGREKKVAADGGTTYIEQVAREEHVRQQLHTIAENGAPSPRGPSPRSPKKVAE